MKKDQDKTKEQLITELKEMRQRVVKLEASEVGHKQAETIPSAAEENYLRLFELLPTRLNNCLFCYLSCRRSVMLLNLSPKPFLFPKS